MAITEGLRPLGVYKFNTRQRDGVPEEEVVHFGVQVASDITVRRYP